jgi:hypothetical protein
MHDYIINEETQSMQILVLSMRDIEKTSVISRVESSAGGFLVFDEGVLGKHNESGTYNEIIKIIKMSLPIFSPLISITTHQCQQCQ